MKDFLALLSVFILTINTHAQSTQFTQHLSSPRLDTTYWGIDASNILYYASSKTNKCQLCFTSRSDTLYEKSCFNSVSGFSILDTTLIKVTKENLIGNWEIVEGGIFEIRDSLFNDNQNFERTFQIIDYVKGSGSLFVTDKTVRIEVLEDGNLVKKQKKYNIIDGQYIDLKGLFGQSCAFRCIGLTKEGFLLMDTNNYYQIIKLDNYLVYKTIVNRTIFKKK